MRSRRGTPRADPGGGTAGCGRGARREEEGRTAGGWGGARSRREVFGDVSPPSQLTRFLVCPLLQPPHPHPPDTHCGDCFLQGHYRAPCPCVCPECLLVSYEPSRPVLSPGHHSHLADALPGALSSLSKGHPFPDSHGPDLHSPGLRNHGVLSDQTTVCMCFYFPLCPSLQPPD